MPNSLRNKIKHLAYKGELNEHEKDRILNALDREVKWIPCSERLPEEDGMYLISTCMNCIDTCLFYKDDDGYLWVDYEESVIAWMPLPAPYQPPTMMCEED